jgi:thiol-disulfide isomerase/thioredoxin
MSSQPAAEDSACNDALFRARVRGVRPEVPENCQGPLALPLTIDAFLEFSLYRRVVVYFYVERCDYCVLFSPIFDGLCKRHPGVSVVKINALGNVNISTFAKVEYYPILQVWYGGKKVSESKGTLTEAEALMVAEEAAVSTPPTSPPTSGEA